MKKSIKLLLLLSLLCTVYANMVSAQNWVDPIWIHVKTNSNLSTKIDDNGKFTLNFPKGGNYDITMSHSEIEKALSSKNVKMSDVDVSLVLYSKSLNGKDSVPAKTVVNKETGGLTIIVPPGGAIISGTISYSAKTDNINPNDSKRGEDQQHILVLVEQ